MMKMPSTLKAPKIAPIYGTNKLLFFGGWKETYENETWIFDLNGGPKGSWKNITDIT